MKMKKKKRWDEKNSWRQWTNSWAVRQYKLYGTKNKLQRKNIWFVGWDVYKMRNIQILFRISRINFNKLLFKYVCRDIVLELAFSEEISVSSEELLK